MSTVVGGLVKIGKTRTDMFETRMTYLESNGYSNVTGLKREYAIEVEDFDSKEKLLHNIFSKSRVGSSELFAIDIELVKCLLSSFEGRQVYPENEKKEDIFKRINQKTEPVAPAAPPDEPSERIFTINVTRGDNAGASAKMAHRGGKFVILAGSSCCPATSSEVDSTASIRKNAVIVDGKFAEDFPCSSPSSAAQAVLGRSSNGWKTWRAPDGKFISEYKNSLA
jgi:hypothetical protein